MTAPAPGPRSTSLATAVESLALQVDRETVLQARSVLLEEVVRLRKEIRLSGIDQGIGLCGRDPVSSDASAAFGERITTLVTHCQRHTDDLEHAANELAEVARRYGFTEDEISSSFGG